MASIISRSANNLRFLTCSSRSLSTVHRRLLYFPATISMIKLLLPFNRFYFQAADSQKTASEGTGQASSGEGDKSGKSNQSDGGKSLRGGPVSWLSFHLLVAIGAGIYYDKEKKRHIEDELQKLAAAVDKIKEKAGIKIEPVFISVEPERDTVEQVREYVKELIGLTITLDEIRTVARAYRMKTSEEDSDYLIDHSMVMYLMGPDMGFGKFFGENNDVDLLTDGIIKEL